MAEAPSLLSLCIALVTDEIVQRDDVPPALYDLPPDLLDTLALQLPPLALHNLQSGMPFELQNEDEYDNGCLVDGRKRRRSSNFNLAWKKNFNLRWSKLTDAIQPVDWQQIYWERHLQSCLDEAAEIASLPSFSKCIGEIEMSDSILKYIASEKSIHFWRAKYRNLSYHCQEFGCYALCLMLQSVLCVSEICHILRSCKLQKLVLRWIRFPEQVNGLCKLLSQNRETLTSLELIHCKLSSTSVNSICDALIHNRKTHGILHFSINASHFDETDPVALPSGLVSFFSSGRYLYSFKLCDNDLGKNFGKLVFHTLLDASSCLSALDLSENKMTGWLSNFNRRSLTGLQASSMVGKSLQSLRVLSLRGNGLKKDDADNLRYALFHIPNLEFLDISDNPIEDDGIRNLIPYFIEASERSFPFADLNLENCELSCDGVTQLLNVLSTLRKPLRSLSVADNSLGSSVAGALGVFMGKSIQILNVEGIGLGPCGFQDLVEGVTEGSNIVNINISKNRGGIEIATFLLKLLSGGSDLVSVNASYNLMPVESLDIIRSALKIAKGKLELLDLRGNNWDDQKAQDSLVAEFQNSVKKILIYSSSPTLDGLYDGDP
ncbi:hypothetical protein IC582_000657 [Cucumis melo]|uniref:Uncharacterized protein LOC103500467 n=2 Tax=Cucumis melo TaxID=3656 RepID=A0A1S3CFT7_CUCME|nr:uncharacterized protein LOC103500467 [Cucumis melo]